MSNYQPSGSASVQQAKALAHGPGETARPRFERPAARR